MFDRFTIGYFTGITILFGLQEATKIDWDILAEYIGNPTRELVFEEFCIFVFPQNIAKGIPNWDTRYETSIIFPVTKSSSNQVGRFIKDYEEKGNALVADKGEIGALHYGPYANVDPGDYIVTFEVFAPNNPSGSLKLDIVSEQGTKLLAEEKLTSSSGAQVLVIHLDQREILEFRVWALGKEPVVYKGVSIKRIGEPKS